MIKVTKDLTKIPQSLVDKTTQKHRQKSIDAQKYVKSDRYKKEDTKKALQKIYNNKCCYCEKDISDSYQQVEHFRPKAIYYWLAHSWDNLLLCCDRCNGFKSDTFDIEGLKAHYKESDLSTIHILGRAYNSLEKPLFINPEIEDVEDKLSFDRSGKILSYDKRVQYTISKCKIDRPEANAKRKKLVDDFIKRVLSRLAEGKQNQVQDIIKDFMRETQNSKNEYLAFRRWVSRNLKTLIR